MNVASTATSENVPHASGMRVQDARRLHRRPGFHEKLDVDVGEVAIGGDFIPMTSLFTSWSVILFSRHGCVCCDSFFPKQCYRSSRVQKKAGAHLEETV